MFRHGPPMKRRHPTVVHLVHGTWPHGPLRKTRPAKAPPAWFERGSDFRAELEAMVGDALDFRVLHWSGRNSEQARHLAANKLFKRLQSSIKQSRGARHIVIGHSHGGTIAYDAVAELSQQCDGHALPALITIATPFAYHVNFDSEQKRTAAWAPAALIVTLCLYCGWDRFQWLRDLSGAALLAATFLMTSLLALSAPQVLQRDERISSFRQLKSTTKLIALRATRDEASLLIGLATTARSFSLSWYEKIDASDDIFSIGKLVRWIVATTPALLLSAYLISGLEHPLAGVKLATAYLIFIGGVSGGIFMLGQLFLAVASGMTDPRRFLAGTAEVDVVPDQAICQMKVYSDLDNVDKAVLRHGVHALRAVRADIAGVLRRIAEGRRAELRETLFEEHYGRIDETVVRSRPSRMWKMFVGIVGRKKAGYELRDLKIVGHLEVSDEWLILRGSSGETWRLRRFLGFDRLLGRKVWARARYVPFVGIELFSMVALPERAETQNATQGSS